MPDAPKKYCNYPLCRNMAKIGARCDVHAHKKWDNSRSYSKRVFKGRTLQRERKRLFDAEPLCAECLKVGRDSVAVIRDHIIPLAEGGQDIPSNTQGLCESCNKIKTQKEAQRGRR